MRNGFVFAPKGLEGAHIILSGAGARAKLRLEPSSELPMAYYFFRA
jgi:hypothetical protein